MHAESRKWAIDEFGGARLGDRRRVARLIAIGADLAERPSSVVANAMRDDAARQAAYDFLENDSVPSRAIEEAVARGCALRAAEHPFVFVAVDGSGISLSDPAKKKQIGVLGPKGIGRGLFAISALVISPDGVPLGIAGQKFWARPEREYESEAERKKADRQRPREERQTAHWVEVIKRAGDRLREVDAKPWWVIDREGDANPIIDAVLATNGFFTIRVQHNRVVGGSREDGQVGRRPRPFSRRRHLKSEVGRGRPRGTYEIAVTATPRRKARRAVLTVHTRRVVLHQKVGESRRVAKTSMNVVWVREVGTVPLGEEPLDWMLYTNHPVDTREDIDLIVHSYKTRWRVEEFHKTWKSGGCDVEHAALRGAEALRKWATILSAVAVRIERLKHLSRTEPDLPATHELSKYELKALLFLKRKEKKRTETIGDNPTIAMATRWIADLGGYTGKSSGGPPGTITIGRGLERVLIAAEVFEGIDRGEVR